MTWSTSDLRDTERVTFCFNILKYLYLSKMLSVKTSTPMPAHEIQLHTVTLLPLRFIVGFKFDLQFFVCFTLYHSSFTRPKQKLNLFSSANITLSRYYTNKFCNRNCFFFFVRNLLWDILLLDLSVFNIRRTVSRWTLQIWI